MTLFDIIFGTSQKIYSAQIEKIPASNFNRQVKLMINGQSGVYSEMGLKNVLVNLARGGISLSGLEEKLKKLGAINNQLSQRKDIISVIKENCLETKEKE